MPYAEICPDVPSSMRVDTEWNEKELIKLIPGALYKNAWRVPLTWPACVQLYGVFKERLSLGPNLTLWVQLTRMDYVDPAMKAREALAPAIPQKPDDSLFPFQRACVDFADVAKNGIIGDDMGVGKTIEALGYIDTLGDDAFPVLIVCPNSVKTHWASRIASWLPYANAYVIEGSAKNRQDIIAEASIDPSAIIIVNYEALRSLSRLSPYGATRLKRCRRCDKRGGDDTVTASTCQVHPKPLNGFGTRTIILDEVHRIKDPGSQQTRAAWQLCHEASVEHRWGLTGTLIARDLRDLWSVMHAIVPEEYPVKSTFIDRYALTAWNSFGAMDVVGLRPDTRDEFYSFFLPRFRRMQKEIVLPQLPPKVHTVRLVDMARQQARMYAELEATLMCRTPEGELLITQSQVAAPTRLSQLACSSVTISDKPDEHDPGTWKVDLKLPSTKIDELLEIVTELGGRQAVVAAEHSKLIDLASKVLTENGIPHLKITGDVSPHDRQRALDALNAGHIKLLLFTVKAGGIGLDMSAASCLIWLQHPWSMVEYLQTVDRVHRVGSDRHESIDIIHIVTRGTIEEDKLHSLQDKLRRLDEITRDRAQLQAAGLPFMDLDNEQSTIVGAFLGMTG